MSDPIRIPLVEDVEPRLADSSKDGLASNVFYDKSKAGQIYAVKRPGLGLYASGQGQAVGIFNNFIWEAVVNYIDGVWSGTKFVVIASNLTNEDFGNNCLVISSEDGLEWTQGFLPTDSSWLSVNWNGTVFCAVGGSVAATSTDGVTWTARTIASGVFNSLIANGSTFVAIDEINDRVAISTDNGVTWSYNPLPSLSGLYRGLAYSAGSGLYMAITDSTGYATSSNLTAWTSRTLPADNHFNIAANSTTFCIARRNFATAYTSTDGINWTERTLAVSDFSWRDLAWTGVNFVLLGSEYTVQYSATGSTWTQGSITFTTSDTYNSSPASVVGNSDMTMVFLNGLTALNSYYYSQDDSQSFTNGNLNRWTRYPSSTY